MGSSWHHRHPKLGPQIHENKPGASVWFQLTMASGVFSGQQLIGKHCFADFGTDSNWQIHLGDQNNAKYFS